MVGISNIRLFDIQIFDNGQQRVVRMNRPILDTPALPNYGPHSCNDSVRSIARGSEEGKARKRRFAQRSSPAWNPLGIKKGN